jgi:hypothetical protein
MTLSWVVCTFVSPYGTGVLLEDEILLTADWGSIHFWNVGTFTRYYKVGMIPQCELHARHHKNLMFFINASKDVSWLFSAKILIVVCCYLGKAQRKIFGTEEEEVTRGCKALHDEKLQFVLFSKHSGGTISRMTWVRHVRGETGSTHNSGRKIRRYLEDLRIW